MRLKKKMESLEDLELSQEMEALVDDYIVRVWMKMILLWGFEVKEIAQIFELKEKAVREMLRIELQKIQFQ